MKALETAERLGGRGKSKKETEECPVKPAQPSSRNVTLVKEMTHSRDARNSKPLAWTIVGRCPRIRNCAFVVWRTTTKEKIAKGQMNVE